MGRSEPNPFLRFLAGYGRCAENHAAYDESLSATAAELGVRAPHFEHPLLGDQELALIDRLQGADPPSVILTGNAGDGKTNLCRNILERLGGNPQVLLASDQGYPTLALPSGMPLRIIKDFTARGEWERDQIMARLAASAFGPSRQEVFLIAANEGIVARKSRAAATAEAMAAVDGDLGQMTALADLFEEMLNKGEREQAGRPLVLLDLSKYPASVMLKHVLHAILDHEAWDACQHPLGTAACTIHENGRRLKNPVVVKRLGLLLDILDQNGEHLTVRHLFALVANALLGFANTPHPMVMDCATLAHKAYREAPKWDGAYFMNLFGHNLARAEKTKPFRNLLALGVGFETNNRIDQLLVFGRLDNQHALFDSLFPPDDLFACRQQFGHHIDLFLEGAEDKEKEVQMGEVLMNMLQAQRRRLFFELPEALTEELNHRELTVFHYADLYRDLKEGAQKGNPLPARYRRDLVCGLNRVFVGGLVTEETDLYLATSGSTSQERISTIMVKKISNDKKNGIFLEPAPGGSGAVYLVVRYDREDQGKLLMTLARFEFLMRVAQGVLPSSFSVQQYEDFLVFKSQLICNLGEDGSQELQILHIKETGQIAFEDVQLEWGES